MAPIVASRTISSFDAFFTSSATLYTLKALAMMIIMLVGYITLRIWRAGRRSTDVESGIPSQTTSSIAQIPRNLESLKHDLGVSKVFVVDVVTYNYNESPRTIVVLSPSKASEPISGVQIPMISTSGAQITLSQQEAPCAPLGEDIADCHFDDSIPSSAQQPSSSSAMEYHTSPEPPVTQNINVTESTADEHNTPLHFDSRLEDLDRGLFSSLPSSESSWSIYHQSISTIVQPSLHGDTTDHAEDEHEENPSKFDSEGVFSSSLPSLTSCWSIHDRYIATLTPTTPATPRKSIPRLVVIPPTPPRYSTSIPDIIITLATPPRRKKVVMSASGASYRKSGKDNKSLEMSSPKRVDKDVRRVTFTQFKGGNYF